VVRRILRRAARYGKKIGLDEPFLYKMVPVLVDQMGGAFPEIGERQKTITEMIQSEEERFSAALEKGISQFAVEVDKLEGSGAKQVTGEVTFDLYTTHGFPMDLTRLLAEERGEALLADFKEASKGDGFQADDVANKTAEGQPATEFKGYDALTWEARILKVTALDEDRTECYVVTDATPCYAESGGQVSDQATLMSGGFRGELVHCSKVGDVFLHRLRVTEGWPAEGQDVMIQVDPVARTRAARNHTATHLLHAALHEVLGKHATQAGSLVGPERLRFDFVNPRAVEPGELEEIEHLVNEQIERDVELSVGTMSRSEADSRGAVAMFGEKYGDVVRVVEVPEFSVELCGGTHVDSTGQIQRFKVLGESSAAANVRRVEALSGPALFDHLSDQASRLSALSGALNAPPDELLARVESMQTEIRSLKKDLAAARKQGAGLDASQVARDAEAVPGKDYRLATAAVEGLTVPDLRDLSDVVLERLGRGVVVLATSHDGKVNFVVKVAKDLVDSGVHAGKLIKEVAAVAGGRGGGRPEMATAGASDAGKIPEALEKAREVLSA
jgi:alanyl-tRNA synthetase